MSLMDYENTLSNQFLCTGLIFANLFFIASRRPIRRTGLMVSARLILPICFRLVLEGLGSRRIHSGTVNPD